MFIRMVCNTMVVLRIWQLIEVFKKYLENIFLAKRNRLSVLQATKYKAFDICFHHFSIRYLQIKKGVPWIKHPIILILEELFFYLLKNPYLKEFFVLHVPLSRPTRYTKIFLVSLNYVSRWVNPNVPSLKGVVL